AGPEVAAHEEENERDREEVERLDREDHHRQEVAAERELGVRQPTAAAAILRLPGSHFLDVAKLRRTPEAGLITDERLDYGARVDDGQGDARGEERGHEQEATLPGFREELALGNDIERRHRPK